MLLSEVGGSDASNILSDTRKIPDRLEKGLKGTDGSIAVMPATHDLSAKTYVVLRKVLNRTRG